MKTVFKTDEITHIWAHQSAPYGRSPSALSFNGPAILSYATEMARHIEHKGKRAIILNETHYSITTSGHQNQIRGAIPSDIPVFRIGNIGRGASLHGIGGKELFEYAIEQASIANGRASRARSNGNKARHQREEAARLEDAQQVSAFFGLRRKVDSKAIERLRKASEAAERKAAELQRQREAQDRANQQFGYDAWKLGIEGDYFNPRNFPVAFRIEDGELVSTFGARVPIQEARLAFAFANRHRSQGWHRNGEQFKVGAYHLDAINEQGIVAGCHRISWAEIERLAPILSDSAVAA